MSNIVPFKITRKKMRELVRQLGERSENLTFINDCCNGEWEELTNYRQMMECLRRGELLTDPVWNEESKTFKFTMGYFHAGQDIVLDLAIENEQHLYIINVCQ